MERENDVLGDTGIINWIGKPGYDLSWLDAENITYIANGDLSLLRKDSDSNYDELALWIDDFRDRDTGDPEDTTILDAVTEGVIPSTALMWGAGKNEEDEIDALYHTQDIPKTYFSTFDWWICNDFEYTQAVIDKVKELNPKGWAEMQEGAS